MNDLLFKVGSPQAIADAIERLVAVGPEQCRTWANNARAIAESEYDERLVIDAYRSEVIALSGKGR